MAYRSRHSGGGSRPTSSKTDIQALLVAGGATPLSGGGTSFSDAAAAPAAAPAPSMFSMAFGGGGSVFGAAGATPSVLGGGVASAAAGGSSRDRHPKPWEEAPEPVMSISAPEGETPRCRAFPQCTEAHWKHYCRICKGNDVDHRSANCPRLGGGAAASSSGGGASGAGAPAPTPGASSSSRRGDSGLSSWRSEMAAVAAEAAGDEEDGPPGGADAERADRTQAPTSVAFKSASSSASGRGSRPKFGAAAGGQPEHMRQVTGILNRISLKTYARLRDKLLSIPMQSPSDLVEVIAIMHKKAVLEKTYAPIYTRLCDPVSRNVARWPFIQLDLGQGGSVTVRYDQAKVDAAKAKAAGAAASAAGESKDESKRGEAKVVTLAYDSMDDAVLSLSKKFFLVPLITMCQERFSSLLTEVDHEDHYARNKHKANLMGNARFIGHLFSAGFLNIKILNKVLGQLCNLAGLTDNLETIPAPGQPGHRQFAAGVAEKEAARKAAKQYAAEHPGTSAKDRSAERAAFVAKAAQAARDAVLNEKLTPEQVAADVEMRELAIEELCELLKVSYDKLVQLERQEASDAAARKRSGKAKKKKKGKAGRSVSKKMVDALQAISRDPTNSNRTRFMCLDVLERDFNQIAAATTDIVDTSARAAAAAPKPPAAAAAAATAAAAAGTADTPAVPAKKTRRRKKRGRGPPKNLMPGTAMFGAAPGGALRAAVPAASAAAAASSATSAAGAGAGVGAGTGAASAGAAGEDAAVDIADIKLSSELKAETQAFIMSYGELSTAEARLAELKTFVQAHPRANVTRAVLSQAFMVAAEKKPEYRDMAASVVADSLANGLLSAAVFAATLDDELQWFCDVLIDVPMYATCVGHVLGLALVQGNLPVAALQKSLVTHVASNRSAKNQVATTIAAALVAGCNQASKDAAVAMLAANDATRAALRDLLSTGTPSSSVNSKFTALGLSL